MVEAISERDAGSNIDQDWLEGHIQITLERKSYEETARHLGKKAREAAATIVYVESTEPGRRRDMSQMKMPFDMFVEAFRAIITRTIKPQRSGGYSLHDLNDELMILTASTHVSAQLLDKMLSENVLKFNSAGNLDFLPVVVPVPRFSAETEAKG